MTKRLAETWTDAVIRCNEEQAGKRAVILYGMELLISTFIGIGLIAVISFIAHEPLAWIFFLLAFIPLRHMAGGYHANTHFQCYLIFSGIFALLIVIEKVFMVSNWLLVLTTLISFIIVYYLSPVVPKNNPLSERRRMRNGRLSLILVCVDVLAALTFFIVKFDHVLLHYYFWGVLSASTSLAAAKINNYQGECPNENENQ